MTLSSNRCQSISLDHLYAINNVIAQSLKWKPALDEILNIIYTVLIFDNLVVYLTDPKKNTLDVMYARAIGRGRSFEADAAWGESIVCQINLTRMITILDPEKNTSPERIDRPFLLGIPLQVDQRFLGVMVLIRFGGPDFLAADIQLAEFIGHHISLLIDRQHLRQDLELLEAHYKQNRLQEDFISTISHELRSPLGFIKGYTTTLLRSDTIWDESKQKEFLNIIDQETDRLQELIDNLLDSSRMQSGQLNFSFQPVRLDAMINGIINRSHLHNPSLIINLLTEGNIAPVIGDPVRLTQVVENLLNNCLKYAPGTEVLITIKQDEDTSQINIIDYGPGIPFDSLPFLFSRFFRIPSNAATIRGTGLGLYICKQIIQAHNGEISANSTEGKGTTFSIRLPNKQELEKKNDSHPGC